MVTALSIVPILWLIVALAVLKMAAWKACSVAAIISFILAVIPPFSQQPVHMAAGAVEGHLADSSGHHSGNFHV